MPRLNQESPLDAFDRAVMRERGLSDVTVRKNELRTEGDDLVISYCGLDGSRSCFARRRPHTPRLDKKGKPIKYEQPPGEPNRPYLPVGSLESLRRPGDAVYITEGEFKALKLSQEGFTAIGLSGIYGWKKKGIEELIDGLKEIDWQGRAVYVVFDYDAKPKTRGDVAQATKRLANLLRAAGAMEVYVVVLPPGADGAKCGVDDFLVAQGDQGVEAFRTLVDAAEPVPELAQQQVLPLTKAEGRTEAANARRLIAKFGEDIRWVGVRDKFVIWDGRRWKLDTELRIHAFAKEVAAELWRELAAVMSAGGVDRDTAGAMFAFVKASSSAIGIVNMVALARSEPGVAISVIELDSHPWLLNVENGTIDLKTGQLGEHRREDFITKLAPVTYDPAATAPMWKKFLATIYADNGDLISYVQRLHGYSLTGDTSEHILPIDCGTGANGKSTKVEAFFKTLGPDYSMKAPPDLLMAKRGESHPTERADLYGKRYVVCIETEAGRKMAESLVKELTGGDRIRARGMREDFWEFAPTHHVWLVTNHKPDVRGTDHGIWRRLKIIPHDVVIADDKQDRLLPEKLAAELPGILNWAIAGCLDWQKNGMRPPAIVEGATKAYRVECDDVGNFIEQFCETREDYLVSSTQLYEAFRKAVETDISQKMFASELSRRGFSNERITRGAHKSRMGWRGLRLLEQTADLPDGFYESIGNVPANSLQGVLKQYGGRN